MIAADSLNRQSRSSRSFFEALDSIDRGRSNPRDALRKHRSMGNIDPDLIEPDSVAIENAKATFQRIMFDGNNDDAKLLKKNSSSTEASASTHHSASSATTKSLDLDDLLSPLETRKGKKVTPVSDLPSRGLMKAKSAKSVSERPEKHLTSRRVTVEKSEKLQTCVPMQATNLQWIDHRGVTGQYAGQVNSLIQPHGHGSLVLSDGTTITGQWCNGTALDRRRCSTGDAGDKNATETQSTLRRRSSNVQCKSVPQRSRSKSRDRHDSKTNKQRLELDQSAPTQDSNSPKDLKKRPSSEHSTQNTPPSTKMHVYQLGDSPKAPSHIIHPSSTQKALQNADSLKIHDFAFVLRSNGTWCYSIVAKKMVPPEHKNGRCAEEAEEASLLFVTDGRGCTKCVKRKHWGKMVRLVGSLEIKD